MQNNSEQIDYFTYSKNFMTTKAFKTTNIRLNGFRPKFYAKVTENRGCFGTQQLNNSSRLRQTIYKCFEYNLNNYFTENTEKTRLYLLGILRDNGIIYTENEFSDIITENKFFAIVGPIGDTYYKLYVKYSAIFACKTPPWRFYLQV